MKLAHIYFISISLTLFVTNQLQGQTIFHKAPYLIYNGNNTEMQVIWQLESSSICTLEWGTNTEYSLGSIQSYEYGDDHQHTYIITDLVPNTKYYYRVIVNEEFYTGSFRSAPNSNATSIKFLVYGDCRTYPAIHDQVAMKMVDTYLGDANFQTFVLVAGDLTSAGDYEYYWDVFFDLSYSNTLRLLADLPYQSCRGNHEDSGVLFAKYFPYPYIDGCYWSFDYGIVHIVVVDQYTDYGPGSAQLTWIENDLASRSNSWNFIILHEPGWSAGGNGNNYDVQNYIQPLCEQYNVHVVFAGHNHFYARALVNNVHHITTAGGGAPLYDVELYYPNLVVAEKAYHFCKVEIDRTQLTITAVDINGNIIDSFAIQDQSLPVELSHFVASCEEKKIILEWITESEVENLGFIIERKESHEKDWQEIANYISCLELKGQGSTPYRTEYRYEDNTVEVGKIYDYRIADVSYYGIKKYHWMPILGISFVKSVPMEYELFQNFPNPTNPFTTLRYNLPQNGFVSIMIYNILGKRIRTLIQEYQESGYKSIVWDLKDEFGRDVSAGIYFYQIRTANFVQTKKMILMK